MAKQIKTTGLPARDRILQVASELFYKQGYRATGINEVIDRSGVAKATFYNHFPSKEDLGMAYLDELKADELRAFEQELAVTKGPLKRFLAPLEWIRSWLRGTDFRGCAFLHSVAEFPDPESPLRQHGKRFYMIARERFVQLADELIASDNEKYGHLSAKDLSESYMVILAGAVALAQIYHQEWPVDDALKTVHKLIGK